jgi:glutamate carboxypeptidase
MVDQPATSSSNMAQLLNDAYHLRSFAIQRLAQLVTVESPTGDVEGLNAMNSLLTAGFEAAGARVVREPGICSDHLVCHWPGQARGDERHVLIIGHSDTVFPVGTTATRPFTVAEDKDTVTGPGVYDMKGALVEVELAMGLVLSRGSSLKRPVRVVIINDEETGSVDGQRVVASHAENAVAVIGLEPPLVGGGLKTGRRGVARWELQVRGIEAHSGLDSARGVSAVDELVDQLIILRSIPTGVGTGVNVGVIEGGTGANVVAGYAQAIVGLRFSTSQDEAALRRIFSSLAPIRHNTSLEFRQLSYRPPWVADPDNPVAIEIVDIARQMGFAVTTGTSGGAGDTNLTGSAGIPTVDGMGPDGAGAHASTEHASINSLLQRAAILAAYLEGTQNR